MKYYNIRTIIAATRELAIEDLRNGVAYFDERDEMCDRVLTSKELERNVRRINEVSHKPKSVRGYGN